MTPFFLSVYIRDSNYDAEIEYCFTETCFTTARTKTEIIQLNNETYYNLLTWFNSLTQINEKIKLIQCTNFRKNNKENHEMITLNFYFPACLITPLVTKFRFKNKKG